MKRIPLQPRTLKFIRCKSVYVERTARFYRGDSYQYLELLPTRVYKRLLEIAILRPQHSQVMENSVHTATLQANGISKTPRWSRSCANHSSCSC